MEEIDPIIKVAEVVVKVAEIAKELSKHVDQPNSSTKTQGSEPAGGSTRKEGEKSQPKHEPIGHHPW